MRQALEIAPGINREHTSFDLRSGAWLDGTAMRFIEGRPETLGKISAVDMRNGATPTTLTGVCRNFHSWTSSSAANVAWGTNSKLYVGSIQNGVVAIGDATPAGLSVGQLNGSGGAGGPFPEIGTISSSTLLYRVSLWSFASWGGDVLACRTGGPIYQGVSATVVTNSPAENIWILMAPVQRQLIALGCNEAVSGTWNPRCIRFSDTQDITDWTPSSSNLAFEYILPEGYIIGGRFVGPYLFVWTNNSLYMGQYVGSETEVWRFDKLGDNCGLAGPLAVCVDGLTAFWMARDGTLKSAQPGSSPVSVDSPVLREMWANMAVAQADKIVVSTIGRFGELHIFYPDARDSSGTNLENSRSVSVNAQGVWSKAAIVRTAFVDVGAAPYPIGVNSGTAYWHEFPTGSYPSCSIETAAQYLDNAQRRVQVSRFWPDLKDQQADVTVTVYGREEPQGTETTLYTGTATTSTLNLDFIVTTRLVRVKFASTSYFRLGKPAFDVQPSSKW